MMCPQGVRCNDTKKKQRRRGWPPQAFYLQSEASTQGSIMKVVAAYLLAVLGGNTTPTAENLRTILGSVGADADDDKIELLLSEVKGKDIIELIASGREKLASVPSGGGGGVDVAAAVSGGGGVLLSLLLRQRKRVTRGVKESHTGSMNRPYGPMMSKSIKART